MTYYNLSLGSTLLSKTALVATIIDDADINNAEISGRNDQPREL